MYGYINLNAVICFTKRKRTMNVHTKSFDQTFKKEGEIWHAYVLYRTEGKAPIELLHLTNSNISILQKELSKKLEALSIELQSCSEEAVLPNSGFIN